MPNDKAIQDPTLAAIERHFEAGSWTHADLEFLYRQARLVPEMLEVLERVKVELELQDYVGDALDKVNKAIRKAKGEL